MFRKNKSLNDIAPHLVNEWHTTKNGNITPYKPVVFGNKYWWKCINGHEWQTRINHRISGSGCPYCSNRKASLLNCLATNYPQLAKEWHPIKNGDLTPFNLTTGSSKKIWWKCSKNHEWQASVNNRTKDSNNCPYCMNRKATSNNCLAITHPELAKEWHSTKNGSITPKDVIYGSSKKVWWECRKGHEWIATINNRTNGKTCPYCSNKKPNLENCLMTYNPTVAKEWHPTKNGDLTPYNVVFGNHKKAWWQCSEGHEWQATIINRTRNHRGCPICQESHGERKVAQFLTTNGYTFKRQCKFNSCINKRPLPFDFVVEINGKNHCIEYQGKQHYCVVRFFGEKSFIQTKENDRIKRKWCKKNNTELLVIPYWQFDNVDNLLKNFLRRS